MTRTCIIAAGGAASRTGLGQYTSKAALRCGGKSLLEHQLDFAHRSAADRNVVVCPAAHASLLARLIPPHDLRRTAIVASDAPTGWAGEVSRAAAFVDDYDEVLLLSCDNLREYAPARWLGDADDFLHTFVPWTRADPPTTGTVYGCKDVGAWNQRAQRGDPWRPWRVHPGDGFTGFFFAGYAVVRGHELKAALDSLAGRQVEGMREMASLLDVLAETCDGRGYPLSDDFSADAYADVASLADLARADARLRGRPCEGPVSLGAGVLLHRDDRVLLCERADGRGWVPPGGIVDAGETFAHAAMRETFEEVGIAVAEQDLRLLGAYSTVGKDGEPACTVVFHARLPYDGVFDTREVKDMRAFTAEETRALAIPFDLALAVEDHFAGREIDCR